MLRGAGRTLPKAVDDLLTETAASRSRTVARFAERRVFELRTFPPETLLPGASVSQDVKCFAVLYRVMSDPHSAKMRSTA